MNMNNFEVCYSEKLSMLYISSRDSNVAYESEFKHGVMAGYNVYGNIVSLKIPDPEILFGIPISDWKSIRCTFNN